MRQIIYLALLITVNYGMINPDALVSSRSLIEEDAKNTIDMFRANVNRQVAPDFIDHGFRFTSSDRQTFDKTKFLNDIVYQNRFDPGNFVHAIRMENERVSLEYQKGRKTTYFLVHCDSDYHPVIEQGQEGRDVQPQLNWGRRNK